MPYVVQVDASGPIRVIQNMRYQLAVMPRQIKSEYLAWQSEDMHRKHPRTKSKRYRQRFRISTKIHPRGRRKKRPGQRTYKKRRRGRTGWVYSTRPILRESLETLLQERMTTLFQTIGWAESAPSGASPTTGEGE